MKCNVSYIENVNTMGKARCRLNVVKEEDWDCLWICTNEIKHLWYNVYP